MITSATELCRRVAIAILTAALMGCGLSQPAPIKQTYLLQPRPAAAQGAGTPRAATLKVGSINVAAPFRTKSLVYRETDLRYEADFYSEYFVSPTAMLTESVAMWLTNAHVFREVLPISAGGEGDFRLEGFVSEMYGDYRDATKPAAVLSVKFFLTDTRNIGGAPVWQTEFTQRVALRQRNSDALVAGMSDALTAILTDLARELATSNLPTRPEP